MSLDGSVCFFVPCHYRSNSNLADPIKGLDDNTLFEAYKIQFDELTKRGFKLKLNVMDDQATNYINQFLDKINCKLQLVEPHNHRVNATECAIQTFKDAFFVTLAITDSNFPIQLWDNLTPQVQNTLNMMRASRVTPPILAYKAINGLYDWNQYPLAPLGCKVIIYEDGDKRGLWASRGVDGWYLGPSLNHYWCDVYCIPKIRAYHILGSTKLFPQHCQLPILMPHHHLCELTEQLVAKGTIAGTTTIGRCLLMLLQLHIGNILTHPPPLPAAATEQRVEQRVSAQQQRVIDDTPIITLQCIMDASAIMASHNPTAKQVVKTTPWIHQCVTRNNTPGGAPLIARMPQHTAIRDDDSTPAIVTQIWPVIPIAQSQLITKQVLNLITMQEAFSPPPAYTSQRLRKDAPPSPNINFEHFTNPMVHPVTGKTISSYHKLMNDLAMAEVWQTAFGKDFGGMAQRDNENGQMGTNAMFVMTHNEIAHVYRENKFFTFASPLVDYPPQKDDPNHICITSMGNLITYDGKHSVRTADINTAKLHWNSVVSMPNAKYMCLNIKNFISMLPLNILNTWRCH
jgi:hypothetical protein